MSNLFIATVGEYLEDGYHPVSPFVDDDAYAKALDSLVLACVDVVPTHQGKMLIGKRTRHPQADWWVMGGRMRTGESFGVSAERLLKSELGLDLAPARFAPLTFFATAWQLRAWPPETNGTHTVSLVMHIELTDDEAKSLKPNDEYSEIKWSEPADVAADESYHPGLRQAASAAGKCIAEQS